MVRGGPDYELWRQPTVRFPLYDLAETAARLGSLSRLDRRGEVIMASGMAPNSWAGSVTRVASDTEIAFSREYSDSLGHSLRMVPGTGDPSEAVWAGSIGIPARGSIGLEAVWSGNEMQCRTEIRMAHSIGGNQVVAAIRHTYSDQVWECRISGGLWTDTGIDCPMYLVEGYWHQVKLVVNTIEGHYNYVVIDGIQYSLADYAVEKNVGVGAEFLLVEFILYEYNGDRSTAWLDRVIVTQAEPEN